MNARIVDFVRSHGKNVDSNIKLLNKLINNGTIKPEDICMFGGEISYIKNISFTNDGLLVYEIGGKSCLENVINKSDNRDKKLMRLLKN